MSVFLRCFLPVGSFDSDCDGAWMDSLEWFSEYFGKKCGGKTFGDCCALVGECTIENDILVVV